MCVCVCVFNCEINSPTIKVVCVMIFAPMVSGRSGNQSLEELVWHGLQILIARRSTARLLI